MRSECGCPFTSGFSRRRNCGCPAITRQGADVLFPAGLESRSPASVLTLRSLGCAPLPLPSSPFNLRTTDPISETLRALTSKPRQPESSCPPPPPSSQDSASAHEGDHERTMGSAPPRPGTQTRATESPTITKFTAELQFTVHGRFSSPVDWGGLLSLLDSQVEKEGWIFLGFQFGWFGGMERTVQVRF